ncbi:MAG: LamG domain-containing protein [Opitutaceae bacterium]|nr:LamG domain-containing protein [Opitutaceae bacterium]
MKPNLPFPRALLLLFLASPLAAAGPASHWPLARDTRNAVPGAPHGETSNLSFAPDGSVGPHARFDGRAAQVRIPASPALTIGQSDFTLTLRVHTAAELDDDLGDLVSHYDSGTRTGFTLALRHASGVTHSQPNHRQLQFGIDAGSEPEFRDEGRPGTAIFGQSMAVHAGSLYVGTCESGPNGTGRVFRYLGPGRWEDCGAPDRANSITAMTVWNGHLVVGSGKYRLGGSALKESENPHLGGRIYRHLGGQSWELIRHFPAMESVGGLLVHRGALHVGSLYRPAAFWRGTTDGRWEELSVPGGKRVEALASFNGQIWATGYDEGHVYRREVAGWTDLGRVGEPENTQTYAFTVHAGRLQVATWRTGKVFEWDGAAWLDRGRLGSELEVMGMMVHNGALYAGTLPLAQLYRHEGGGDWRLLRQLDTTPDVQYRRVWTMAEYQGRLFATTLPSGHVWSLRAGATVSWDHELPSGWRHIAAQREGDTLRLWVDGEKVAESRRPGAERFNLSHAGPWKIGAGPGDFFNGGLADVRYYRRALGADEIRAIAREPR